MNEFDRNISFRIMASGEKFWILRVTLDIDTLCLRGFEILNNYHEQVRTKMYNFFSVFIGNKNSIASLFRENYLIESRYDYFKRKIQFSFCGFEEKKTILSRETMIEPRIWTESRSERSPTHSHVYQAIVNYLSPFINR